MKIHGLSYRKTIKNRGKQTLERHKKLLTLLQILNELMYDFDKKSKQNIRAIYYIVSTFGREG